MKDAEKKDKQKSENPINDYNPTARDFQRTPEDLNSVSQSEKEQEAEEQREANKRTEKGNTTPNKNRMS